jgi:hypothetical protein
LLKIEIYSTIYRTNVYNFTKHDERKANDLEYIIYTDESSKEGRFYGNFFGGALVRSYDLKEVISCLEATKQELGFRGEVKWEKVTLHYLEKYKELMNVFFDFISKDKVKIRIMFTHNYKRPINLTKDQMKKGYSLLYYQFLKHAFGLQYSNPDADKILRLRLYCDELPLNLDDRIEFKWYVHNLQYGKEFQRANISIPADQITEVNSHDHVILQCLDIVLGSINFRLNDFHKEKPEGSWKRGKRTIAKDKLYKHIYQLISQIIPNFNIGVTTKAANKNDRWNYPYRHWEFIPKEHKIAPEFSKRKKQCPVPPT